MNPTRSLALVLPAVPLLLAAGFVARPTADDLVRLGDAAFVREDFSGAIAFYERAEERTTDPGRVAFSLATARYHLVRSEQGSAPTLREAEQGFRCCLEGNDERRGPALLGLANCLLLRAGGEDGAGPLDPTALREAIDTYDLCLTTPSDADLGDAVRHNRERARLLLAQVLSHRADAEPGSSGEEPQPTPPRTEMGTQPASDPTRNLRPDPDKKAGPAEKGAEAKPTDLGASPGRGDLPPVPERSESINMSPGEAAAQLEQAARQVIRERLAYRRGRSRALGGGAKNW
jgi:hypothetical protein